jgi:hypothetical protein
VLACLARGEESWGAMAASKLQPPGRDAWTLGNEPCIVIDWQVVADYAKA